jgi:hypothetical protein
MNRRGWQKMTYFAGTIAISGVMAITRTVSKNSNSAQVHYELGSNRLLELKNLTNIIIISQRI